MAQEYKVRIEVELPDEARERIDRAIQRAVLLELAGTDVANGYSVVLGAAREKADGERLEFGGRFKPGGPIINGITVREDLAPFL